MPSTATRRPWPALVALLALLLLAALVWWRVINRNDSGSTPQAGGTTTCTPSPTPSSGSASPSGPSGSSSTSPAAQLPAPSSVTVKVLNSTNRRGLAGAAQAALIKDGFHSPQDAANDTKHKNKIKGVAEIRFGPKGRDGATLLKYYFPGAKLLHIHAKRATVTVSLGKKFQHVASEKQVRAAMTADAVSASSTATASSSAPAPC
jgi:hypothetical protein